MIGTSEIRTRSGNLGAALVLSFAALIGSAGLAAADTDRAPLDEPGLTGAELGHLVNFLRLTDQPIDDWTGWDAREQEGLDAYRYQIAFMAYALALQQYNSVPAWREFHHEMLNSLMNRLLHKDVWEFWANESAGRIDWDPDWEPGIWEETRDPVGRQNIMYSGHIVHIAALIEMLYRDKRWSEPGAYTFAWDETEIYEYDQQSLLKIIHREMLMPREKGGTCVAGVECEPNLIFPECNQHPMLAFMLNDAVHGTDLYETSHERLGNFFECIEMFDSKNAHVAAAYRVRQAELLRIPVIASASADGWTGAFMHAWRPEMIKAAYEKQKARHIREDAEANGIKLGIPDPMWVLGAGFFGGLAMEVGDADTAEGLFDYAVRRYQPVWDNGAFRYPHQPEDKKNNITNTTDKVLAMARSNRPGGLSKMHNSPWGDDDFNHPLLEGVAFPSVFVRQAWWNADTETLTVTLEPGVDSQGETKFRIAGADAAREWTLTANGRQLATIGPETHAAGNGVRVTADGSLEVTTPITAPVRFELRAKAK